MALALGAAYAAPAPNSLETVRRFADTLLEHGTDRLGPKHTALFASVIDTRDYSIPKGSDNVPPTPGVRKGDRALGGCNAQLDTHLLRTLHTLSAVTGDPRYAAAARAYAIDFLKLAQSPATGLLAWGEHLYYDLHEDRVVSERQSHEYLEWSPPWDLLWAADPEAVKREVAGLRFHFYAEDPATQGWLYNRHANWGSASYQKPGGQPWIKHSGLYAFAYGFVASKTGDAGARRRALGVGSLYFNVRNPQTGLTESCLTDKRPTSRNATLAGVSMLAYWLVKAAQADPELSALRSHALSLLHDYARLAWDEQAADYAESLPASGARPAVGKRDPWSFAYGDAAGLMRFGRVAAYLARTEKDPASLLMAQRAYAALQRYPMPDKFTPEEAGFAIHLALDLHDLTKETPSLEAAHAYAGKAIPALLHRGLFRRLPGDFYYESKLGPGDLASALLRLHLRATKTPDPAGTDWSF